MNTLIADPNQAQGIGFAVSSNTIRQIADEIIAKGKVERAFLGVSADPLTPRQAVALGLPPTTGAIVTGINPGTPAAQVGIRVGDVITKVNDQAIDQQHPLQSVMVKFRPGDKVRLTIIRGGTTMTVDVTLGARPS
jgi:S1-C subfamily serine protease